MARLRRFSGVTDGSPVDVAVRAYNDDQELPLPRGAVVGDCYGIAEDGVGTIVIDPVRAFGTQKVALANFKVKLSVSASTGNLDEELYRIYDLTTGSCESVSRKDILNGRYGAYETDYSNFGSGFATSASDVLIWTGVTNGLVYKTDKLVMRRIKAGTFTCGGNLNTPGVGITIDHDYFIGVFEATYAQCEHLSPGRANLFFSNETCCAARPMDSLTFGNIRGEGGTDWPENQSATLGANTYVGRIRNLTGVNSFDLPQEIHWEYAARGGTQTIWNNGMTNEASQDQNTALPLIARTKYTGGWGWSLAEAAQPDGSADLTRGTAEVGSYLPNAFGLYDCHGNVAEWCLDRGLAWGNVTADVLKNGSTTADKSERVVKGAHWGQEDDTGAYLKAHAKDIDMSKLFFHVQHPHPPRTVYSPGRTDKSILRNDLSRYSNCFSLSGHGHESAAYETALWQGSFTALGGSSTKSPVTLAPRENGGWVLRMRTPQPITPTVDAGRGSHAMIVSVYAHELVVERHEFVYDEPLGEEWVLPLPLETHPEGPCVIAARAEAPRFADDAQLTVERCRTKTRQKETVEAFRAVSPPAIPAKHHGRVTDYRVEVLDGEGGPVVATRLLMQPRLTLSERQLGSDVTIACLIPCAEIVGVSDPVFTVSPLNAGGKGGSPLIARSNPARKAH